MDALTEAGHVESPVDMNERPEAGTLTERCSLKSQTVGQQVKGLAERNSKPKEERP